MSLYFYYYYYYIENKNSNIIIIETSQNRTDRKTSVIIPLFYDVEDKTNNQQTGKTNDNEKGTRRTRIKDRKAIVPLSLPGKHCLGQDETGDAWTPHTFAFGTFAFAFQLDSSPSTCHALPPRIRLRAHSSCLYTPATFFTTTTLPLPTFHFSLSFSFWLSLSLSPSPNRQCLLLLYLVSDMAWDWFVCSWLGQVAWKAFVADRQTDLASHASPSPSLTLHSQQQHHATSPVQAHPKSILPSTLPHPPRFAFCAGVI